MIAVTKDPYQLQFVRNQTKEIVEAAVEKEEQAVIFALPEFVKL